jgi:uncharacterized protein YcbK (DUF882 family)
MQHQRRRLLIGGIAGLAGLAGIERAFASLPQDARSLTFYHIHTAEKLKVTYREHGRVDEGAIAEINHFLRDFRTGETCPIDVALLDKLSTIYDRFGRRGRYEVISGYRSPRTNAALRHVTTGVAEHSFHMSGRAIDVRLVGTETVRLRDAALALADGGVGYYPESNFVHMDTGPVRAW